MPSLHDAIHAHVEPDSVLHTDEHGRYRGLDGLFCHYHTINHVAGQYVRNGVSTNSIESVWALMRRSLHGVYQRASDKHLHRYLNEFTFHLNDGNVDRYALDRLTGFVDATVEQRIAYKVLIQ